MHLIPENKGFCDFRRVFRSTFDGVAPPDVTAESVSL